MPLGARLAASAAHQQRPRPLAQQLRPPRDGQLQYETTLCTAKKGRDLDFSALCACARPQPRLVRVLEAAPFQRSTCTPGNPSRHKHSLQASSKDTPRARFDTRSLVFVARPETHLGLLGSASFFLLLPVTLFAETSSRRCFFPLASVSSRLLRFASSSLI